MRADAFAAGAGCDVDWKRTLRACGVDRADGGDGDERGSAQARRRRHAGGRELDARGEHARLDSLAANTGSGRAEHGGRGEQARTEREQRAACPPRSGTHASPLLGAPLIC
jgi:hypothetical protein